MIKGFMIGAVSITTLLLSHPTELENSEEDLVVSPLTSQVVQDDASESKMSLDYFERLLYMSPAIKESEKSKSLRKKVQENLNMKEQERAEQETRRLTEEEKKKVEKEWIDNFPTYPESNAQQIFLNEISRDAVEVAYQNGIYPSVMMAQAGLESNWGRSGLARNYNNLMGTKGSWKGKTVNMRTREDVGGQSIYINAGFSVYDSWRDSLDRYGQLLRNGPNGNSAYYAGAWRANTKNYKEATSWLQGRYATDTQYAAKLNQTIELYDLARFDSITPLDKELEVIEVKVEPERILLTPPEGIYEVKEGDSLLSIALTHEINIEDLMEWNSLQSPLLEEKQWLVIELEKVKGATEEDKELVSELMSNKEEQTEVKQTNKEEVAKSE